MMLMTFKDAVDDSVGSDFYRLDLPTRQLVLRNIPWHDAVNSLAFVDVEMFHAVRSGLGLWTVVPCQRRRLICHMPCKRGHVQKADGCHWNVYG